jgi:hypothetical protein
MLIGVSPDHSGDGAIEKYDFSVHTLTTLKSNLGTPSGLAFMPAESAVTARDLFYHNSPRYDTTGNAVTPLPFSDDNAIAIDKSAYIPSSASATFNSVSSYSLGINGVMIDLLGGGSHTSITLPNILNDFTFKVGNNNSPSTWINAPNPIAVTVRTNVNPTSNGAGTVNQSDRVELVWADGAIEQEWLEVIVKSTANTGLAANDVFFFGNEIGDANKSNTATIFKVTASDTTATQIHAAPVGTNQPITNQFDYNRDGAVGAADITIDQIHGTTNSTGLVDIAIPTGGPFAPPPAAIALATAAASPATNNGAEVASALTAGSTANPATAASPVPRWLVSRLQSLDFIKAPIAQVIEQWVAADQTRLMKFDTFADALEIDDLLLDTLIAKLKSA